MAMINCLSLQLLQEGWTREQTPPGCSGPWKDYYGGWEYSGKDVSGMTFKAPCGLLVSGKHFVTGHMSYMGMEWTVENDNPTITCPTFRREPCPLNHTLLREHPYFGGAECLTPCACHRTERPYTYEGSVAEAHDQVWAEADRLFEEFDRAHGGRACRHQSRYNRTTKRWSMRYDPQECARMGGCCHWCKVLQTELNSKKGNVFYDLKTTWTEAGEGLFPDVTKTRITKGVKLLEKTVSLTICEAIAKYARHRVIENYQFKRHHELFFDKSLRYELLNIRAARMDVRDLLQDLQDVRDGIMVEHQADNLKAVKAQKHQRKEAATAKKLAKLEARVLKEGDTMPGFALERAERRLGWERVQALLREAQRPAVATNEPEQLSFLL